MQTTTYTAAPRPAPNLKVLAITSLTQEPLPPLAISPVIHPRDGVADPRSRTFWSAVANACYIARRPGADLFGPTPDLADKLAAGNDLVDHGRRGPIGCDADAIRDLGLWDAADQAAITDRPSEPVAFHLIGFLPPDLDPADWREPVLAFLDAQAVQGGMVADWAIHALPDGKGSWTKKPHFHGVLTHRFWKPVRRTGEPNPAWLGNAKARQKLINAWEALTRAAA